MENNELIFLGTSACDFSPRLETDLKGKFDKDARRSSAVLLNRRYLIDCGIHCLESLAIAGADMAEISDIFVTHLHRDHYNAGHIAAIAEASRYPEIRLWVSETAVIPPIPKVRVMPMKKFVTYPVDETVKVTGLEANHDMAFAPQWLLLETAGKKLLYALDGAWYVNSTYFYLRKSQVDLAVNDATVGDYTGDFRAAEHNSLAMLRVLLPSLRTMGIFGENTAVYFSHLAPSLHRSHAETVEIAREMGARVAYDGLRVTF